MDASLDPEFLQTFDHLELLAKQVVEGFITGLHKSPFHGFSVEFSEHRLYNPGESTRFIDWKLLARTDKLFVKRFEDETNLRCQLIIDISGSMYFPEKGLSKIRFSVVAAAALMQLMAMQRDACALHLISDQLDYTGQARSTPMHRQLLLAQLEQVLRSEKRTATAMAANLHALAETLPRRSMVVIFSDMFDHTSENALNEVFNALQHLRFMKHEVILFHTLEESMEQQFTFENRPYRFIDLESGAEIKLHPNEVKEDYLKGISAFEQRIREGCRELGIDYHPTPVNGNFNQLFMTFLIKRSGMK